MFESWVLAVLVSSVHVDLGLVDEWMKVKVRQVWGAGRYVRRLSMRGRARAMVSMFIVAADDAIQSLVIREPT